MRALTFVCLFALLGSAEPKNLLPRAGSGWAGFKTGSSVKLKLVQIPKGQNARVTIWTTTLKEVGAKQLTLATVAENVLQMKSEQKTIVPREGEAQPGEKARTEIVGDEILLVGRKRLKCKQTRTKLRSATGRRVINDWIATDPRVRVKRVMQFYDKEGALTQSITMVLNSLNETRTVAAKQIPCLRYRFLMRQKVKGKPDIEEVGTVYTSRAIPGNDVYMDTKVRQGGVALMDKRLHALAFTTK